MLNTSRAFYIFLVACWLSLGLHALAARAATPPSAEPSVATDVSGNGHPAPAPEEQRSPGRLAKIFRSG